MGLFITTLLLMAFSTLALIDGFYLHILRYKLYHRQESYTEHLTHTARAILFPLIVYFLFISQGNQVHFMTGCVLVLLDLIVLAIDAYIEKDSRAFMGGLPRWEYILHLFVNGFHFAAIAVFLAIKLSFTAHGIAIVSHLEDAAYFSFFSSVSVNLLPGAVLMGFVHVITSLPPTQKYWLHWTNKLRCC